MFSIFQGRRPDITAAQIGAVLVAGVPAIATLLTAFGAATSRRPAGRALRRADLVGDPRRPADRGDATLRAARNLADAKTDAAAMTAGQARCRPTTASRTPPPTSKERQGGAGLRRRGVLRRERDRAARGEHDRRRPRPARGE